jgi:hypothetical protein
VLALSAWNALANQKAVRASPWLDALLPSHWVTNDTVVNKAPCSGMIGKHRHDGCIGALSTASCMEPHVELHVALVHVTVHGRHAPCTLQPVWHCLHSASDGVPDLPSATCFSGMNVEETLMPLGTCSCFVPASHPFCFQGQRSLLVTSSCIPAQIISTTFGCVTVQPCALTQDLDIHERA